MEAKHIKELMDAWNTIEQAALKQFPKATKEEIYLITKHAMDKAIAKAAAKTAVK